MAAQTPNENNVFASLHCRSIADDCVVSQVLAALELEGWKEYINQWRDLVVPLVDYHQET